MKSRSSECLFNFIKDEFNMVRTPSSRDGLIVIAQFLKAALTKGERVAFGTFQNPQIVIDTLAKLGFDFREPLESERLVYFYYKRDFAEKLSLGQDFKGIFNEIKYIGGKDITSVAFENADVLFNKQSNFLLNSSVQKLASAASHKNITFLGQYVRNKSEIGKEVDHTCQSLLAGYYILEDKEEKLVTDLSIRSAGNARKSVLKLGKGFVRK